MNTHQPNKPGAQQKHRGRDGDGVQLSTKFFGIKKGPVFTSDGKLFGSTTALGVALKNMVQFTGMPFKKVLRTVTLNPAKLLNIQDRKGSLKKGSDADIVILDKEFNVKEVFVKGKKVPAN